MLKKKFIIITMIVLGLLIMSEKVNAADTLTSTSTINDVTVNWSYTLNTSNEVADLKCTNPEELTGDISIPSSIDGKNVVSIGESAFLKANGITGVTIPNTIKIIKDNAFNGCTKLSNVDLGKVETIYYYAFKDCTSLTKITIPKSLSETEPYNVIAVKNYAIFSGCTNLTDITLENGLTKIAPYLLSETKIKNITIPNTVTAISFSAFQDCTKLESVVLPNSVKVVQDDAFKGCESLSSVDLGQIEDLYYYAFRDCPKLISIKIPSTLNKTTTYRPTSVKNVPIFTGTTNITTATLSDGLTIVAPYILADTNITEITIPNTVQTIDYSAFEDCSELLKITILDNVTKFGNNVFKNHNENLTIYCYEGSVAAKYAIANNIKYVYLTRPVVEELTATVAYNPTTNTTGTVTATIKTNKKVKKVDGWTLSADGKTLTKTYSENKTEIVHLEDEDGQTKDVEVKITNITKSTESKDDAKNQGETGKDTSEDGKLDGTESKDVIPQAGANLVMVFVIGIALVATVVVYNKIKRLKGVK